MGVVDAVERDLEEIRRRDAGLADSALAASALVLARELDDLVAEEECEECGHVQSWTTRHNSATSKSMCARALTETMDRLRELAPPEKEQDDVDEVGRKRVERRAAAGVAATATRPSP